ncbi:AAA family ATPase [Cellulomonas persica]|uniref:Nuclease SbcCD subunit C n=1 Tax=Cellulomonas persica TaxID=76861 RepID=A0A510UVQ2_9CELL|nr:AAA family ATPase [Cellulomonas persica]GEK18757.1 nuclease SbcCD subunit C [Cellulomonas persica]
MQLVSLTLQAIGPFAGRHTIDFAELGASGLFLLEGPTGAGKSTVIDAVVFALYGKVASAESSGDRVRSAYADDETESFVDLTFEVGAGRFRVRRTPAFDRAKKRGTGTVRQQASVRLWRLAADGGVGPDDEPAGEMISPRLDEAGAEIQRIVGLDREQFVQTIVLPQGEFARFLRADPEKERPALLQKIFGTEVYQRMQARLVEMRREADRATEATRRTVEERVAHLAGAAGLDETALAPVHEAVGAALVGRGAAPDVEAALAGPLGALAEDARLARAHADAAAATHAAASSAAEVAQRTARLLATRDRLRGELTTLEDAAQAHADRQVRLLRARAARAVRPQLRAVEDATVALDAAAKGLAAARDVAPTDLAELVALPDPADGPDAWVGLGEAARAELVGAHDDALRAAAALEHAVRVEASLQSLRLELTRARGAVENHETELAAHDAWLDSRPGEAAALTSALEAARAVAADEAELAVALRAAKQCVEAHVQLGALLERRDHAAADVEQAAQVALLAVEREAAARAARIAGLAGELAAGLVPGEGCPVCGSVEHPAPAALDADHVTADEVALAEQTRQRAEAALTRAREVLAGLESEVGVARDATGGVTAADAGHELVEAERRLTAARAAGADVTRLRAQIDAHAAATEQRRRERAVAHTAREKAAMLVDARADALNEAEAEVARACGDHPTVAARHAELVERATVAADLRSAVDDAVAAGLDLQRRASELDEALTEHGFLDAAAARVADLPDADALALERAAREHDTALDRTRTGLRELDGEPLLATLEVVDGEAVAPDVAAAVAAERDAADQSRTAAGRAGVAVSRAGAAQEAARSVVESVEEHARRLGDAAPVLRIAGLASGTGTDNGHGLSLSTYVLVRRFEDVVAAANARLVGMSDGRYELTRSDRKEDVSSRRTGLAMRVLDHHTEQARDPRTLSGGETFYVSLCLALGLADVVTAEAGGIDLGTLFVDEGFGTLDAHTLDQVLGELDRLRAGGRVVGVVSHVDALKQTIADRIEVRRTPAGPSTLTVRAG